MERLAFDMSSFMWRGLLAGKDPSALKVEHEGKEVTVNTAAWGYENCVSLMVGVFKETKLSPINAVLVFEGVSSKVQRQLIDPSYKSNRDSRPDAAYLEFHKLREQMENLWRKVGAACVSQDYVEGDDVLGYLAMHCDVPLTVATYDWDLSWCNTNCNAKGQPVQVWIDGLLGVNKYGPFDYHLISTYKALVGDSSDGIKGVEGFGPGMFKDFCTEYGYDGLQELHTMLLQGGLSPDLHAMSNEVHEKGPKKGKPVHPIIRRLCDQEERLLKCFRLTTIHHEWVNTMTRPLKWKPGVVLGPQGRGDERLAQWYGKKVLVTADNYAKLLDEMRSLAQQSPFCAFDIETSSAEESDDWMAAQGDPDGVDQMGSRLTGFSITCGKNLHRTVYVSVDHAATKNITMVQAREFLEGVLEAHRVDGNDTVVHNSHFELPVLYCAEDEDGTPWRERWKDNGQHGFIPRMLDTKLEASYVNENEKLGLKHRSFTELDYKQTEYDEVTTLMEPNLLPGGRHKGYRPVLVKAAVTENRLVDPLNGGYQVVEVEPALFEDREIRSYKMNELPATHVFDYGCDDTICTAGLHVHYRFVMGLEPGRLLPSAWAIYKAVEIGAAYLHAKNYVDGVEFSLEKSKELEAADNRVYDESWAKLRAFLITKGWDGTVPPSYTPQITAKEIKEAFTIVFNGDELDTMVRTPSKLVKMLQAEGELVFSSMLQKCLEGDAEAFTKYVCSHFTQEPRLNMDSPKQIQRLLYETMALPVKVRNKPTKDMKARGEQGSPKTDELAIKYAMLDATPELKELLESLWLMRMVLTRRELFYGPYPYFVHWKTGRIHASHNQCGTNTRRASEKKPNKQQLPKHAKVELALLTEEHLKAAVLPRFRETILPHKRGAVVVSMDFAGQELRVIASYSGDENLTACFVGDNKKDVHSLTGTGIAMKREPAFGWTYERFSEVRTQAELDKEFASTPVAKAVKIFRALGKKTNFVAEYGAMAPKVAATLMVTEEEAQEFLDAREAMFPQVAEWKLGVIQHAKDYGWVDTMLGARRHLAAALTSDDYMEANKAERQAVNFKVQGSSGEMTKLAESRMWDSGLFFKYDAVCYGPIHDEVVASVMIEDLPDFIADMHRCMVVPYADMTIPVVSSISFGPNFGEQFEIGEEPTKEAVLAGLEAMRKAMESSKEELAATA